LVRLYARYKDSLEGSEERGVASTLSSVGVMVEIYLTVALRTLFGLGWVLLGYHLFFFLFFFFSGKGKGAYSRVR
jgi:hypothetical protein